MATVYVQKRRRKNRKSCVIYYKDPRTGRNKYYKTFRRLKDAQQSENEVRTLLDQGKSPEVHKKKIRLTPLTGLLPASPAREGGVKGSFIKMACFLSGLRSTAVRQNPRAEARGGFTFQEVGKLLVSEWNGKLVDGEVVKGTFDEYLRILHFVGKTFSNRLLCKIQRQDILSYRAQRAVSCSNVTSNRDFFIIKQVFKHGLQVGAITYDPTATIKKLSEREHERNRYLLPGDLDRIVEASRRTRAKFRMPAMIYLGAEHGASKQEVLDLKWPDINFDFADKGIIRLYRTKNKRERTEFLMPRTREALLSWQKHQQLMRHRKKIKTNGSDLVFCRLDGTPINRFDKAWRTVCKIAGLKNFHFHDLRHTFCSNARLAGADLQDVKGMIGHRDLSTTDRYTHIPTVRKLALQEALAKHYANAGRDFELNGLHIGYTKPKTTKMAGKRFG